MKQPPPHKIFYREKRLETALLALMSTAVFQAKRDYRHPPIFVKCTLVRRNGTIIRAFIDRLAR
jgi:hypothetical protein